MLLDRAGKNKLVDIDYFPCGCLITTQDQKILFLNKYFEDQLGWVATSLENAFISKVLTPASAMYCESYIVTTALKEGQCYESQLTVVDTAGDRHPKVVSVRYMPNGNLTWVFVEAEKRDRLFHELESARLELQSQKELLERLSLTDALTGVANRRAFDAAIQRTFADAERSEMPLTVLMMDIDNFKSINDVYGHKAGDEALLALCNVLRAICGEEDTIARFGGDEFVCILTDCSLEEAREVCNRIHIAVAERMNGICNLTVSIGASVRTTAALLSGAEALKRADMALYDAKNAGRNRTSIQAPKSHVLGSPE